MYVEQMHIMKPQGSYSDPFYLGNLREQSDFLVPG